MKLKLDASLSSPQDLQACITEVRSYARWFAHNSIKKQVKAGGGAAQPELSPAANAIIRDWISREPLTSKSLDKLIDTLEAYVHKAPRVAITLAAPATPGIKKDLVGWCRDNIAPDVLVSFEFNANLLGGMVVRYGSHIFDWSFRRQLLAGRAKFPEVLRNV